MPFAKAAAKSRSVHGAHPVASLNSLVKDQTSSKSGHSAPPRFEEATAGDPLTAEKLVSVAEPPGSMAQTDRGGNRGKGVIGAIARSSSAGVSLVLKVAE